eukprot:GHVQ01007696.1.p2 GENE.GHVQ01007696.1~~GHVQ01007696.1.p2  ORF type:complete len:288 (+),score=49.84 GHVQ01007696.1:609-1472(+)
MTSHQQPSLVSSICSSASLISVDLTHSMYPKRRWAEIRLDPCVPIRDVKQRLYRHVGTDPSCMKLYNFNPLDPDSQIAMFDDDFTLSMYGCTDGCIIHITTTGGGGPGTAPFVDTDDCDIDPSSKFIMTDEDYAKRTNTARMFIQSHKQKDKEKKTRQQEESAAGQTGKEESFCNSEEKFAEYQATYPLNSRCRVNPGDRRGSIGYVGYRPSRGGQTRGEIWIGIKLDEPLGNTDGADRVYSDKGQSGSSAVRLFECYGDKYGEWATPRTVDVGDFPPYDPFDVDEM